MPENLSQQLNELQEIVPALRERLFIEDKKKKMTELEMELTDQDIWKNRQSAEQKNKEAGQLRDLVKQYEDIEKELKNAKINIEQSTEEDAKKIIESIRKKIKQLEIKTLFSGKYDKQSAVISIFAGAGGQDAEDWVSMLYEMYRKFCEKRGWKTKVIDESLGDFQSKTGRHPIKNVTIEIKGDYAYGFLKKEIGVHRLVRISPFSPEQKRHTSFALVEVLPELEEIESSKFEIPEDELKVEFSRAGGPGGQNVNKVETAVRIIHLPTNIVVSSRVERSQAQNREKALKLLKAKLVKLMEETKAKELSQLRTKVKPEWGNQIRSYILNPYKLVKDHRNGIETSQVDKVLEGELDVFIESEV